MYRNKEQAEFHAQLDYLLEKAYREGYNAGLVEARKNYYPYPLYPYWDGPYYDPNKWTVTTKTTSTGTGEYENRATNTILRNNGELWAD